MTLLFILAIMAVLVFWLAATYNKLIKNKNLVAEGWSGIDVQLKRRSNLIPNLVEAVKGYMGHEKSVLTEVTDMRTKCLSSKDNIQSRAQNESMLSSALSKLFAVAENYPDLKASANFQALQNSLETVENELQSARRYYNGTARDFNIIVQSFPSNLVAQFFKFVAADYFEIDTPEERAVPKVDFNPL